MLNQPMSSKTHLGGDEATGNGQRKRLQRVEILKIAEPCPLIDPSQVVVTQGEILVADPVLTPIGKTIIDGQTIYLIYIIFDYFPSFFACFIFPYLVLMFLLQWVTHRYYFI
jgi:hypothetical protein